MKRMMGRAIVTMAWMGMAMAGAAGASAAIITESNLFSHKTVTASSEYNTTYVAANVTDGTTSPLVFTDAYDNNKRLTISGFNSAVDVVRIYNDMFGGRASGQVAIYYSLSVTTSLNYGESQWTSLGSFTLPTDTPGTAYTLTDDLGNKYAQIDHLGAPAGTQSLLFVFTRPRYGPSVEEIQGFAPAPEPATMALLAIGAGAVLIRRRA